MASGVFGGAKSAFSAVRDVQGDQTDRPLILCGDKDVLAGDDEQCDDGNLVNNDGCDDACKLEAPE